MKLPRLRQPSFRWLPLAGFYLVFWPLVAVGIVYVVQVST